MRKNKLVNNIQNRFCVYVDYTTDGNIIPYYAGKGTHNRLNIYKRNIKHDRIMKKYGINRVILFDNLTEPDAFKKEIEVIASYKLNCYRYPENKKTL